MARIISSLPTATNDGRPTARALETLVATLRAAGVVCVLTPGCTGIWWDEGTCYEEAVTLAAFDGNRNAIVRALAAFGAETAQLAMLCVDAHPLNITQRGAGIEEARDLALRNGGATLLPTGDCFSLRYSALEAGKDYEVTPAPATNA